MVKFSDIQFRPHPNPNFVGVQGLIFFPGGYGLSIVRFKISFGDDGYSSYTSNEDEWEVAILKGNETKWEICYDTLLTDDVLGYSRTSPTACGSRCRTGPTGATTSRTRRP